MFGALGWSFGGSISYMQVVAYTHSGHSPSVLYGFACLFVIGFLWAALGGAGTALPAVVDQAFLSRLFLPDWASSSSSGGCKAWPSSRGSGSRASSCSGTIPTGWRRLLALIAVFLVVGVRRRLDRRHVAVLHLAAGWWAGFLVLVLVLHLHMTPPRGDNWAGCLGMTVGLLWYCRTAGLLELARAALVCGFIGGIGFAAASMLKLVEVTSGYQTNWHSILEQTTGLFNGIGLAVAVAALARRTSPRPRSGGPAARGPSRSRWASSCWGSPTSTCGRTWRNGSQSRPMPAEMAGLSPPGRGSTWDTLAWPWRCWCSGCGTAGGPCRSCRQSWLGKGQLLYLGLLWWLVAGNFERALVAFKAERLVTEGVIYLVALACTLVVALVVRFRARATPICAPSPPECTRTAGIGNDGRGGPGRGDALDRGRLGRRPGDLRRPLRRPRQAAHPVRPQGDDQPARESLSGPTSRPWLGRLKTEQASVGIAGRVTIGNGRSRANVRTCGLVPGAAPECVEGRQRDDQSAANRSRSPASSRAES